MVNKGFQLLLVTKRIYGYIELQLVFIITVLLNIILCLKYQLKAPEKIITFIIVFVI